MARSFTAGERNAIAATAKDIAAKFSVTKADGSWVDLTAYLVTATLERTVDDDSWRLNAELVRDDGALASLAPLREDSTLNDLSGSYSPLLDPARKWKVETSVVTHGSAASYKELCWGYYDVIDLPSNPTVQLTGRDPGALLLDYYVHEAKTYGDATNPVAIQTVLQQILNDNGFSSVTLYDESSVVFLVEEYTPADVSLMAALNTLAQLAGCTVRYEYGGSPEVLRLSLIAPNRAATAGDEAYTLAPSEYYAVPKATLDLTPVRNWIRTSYWDDAAADTLTITTENTTSQTRYAGIKRKLLIDLAKNTYFNTSARVSTFNDAVLSDLEYARFEHQYETPGFWIAELGDYAKLTANGVHYSTDQYGAVNSIRHVLQGGTMRTTLAIGGQPAGRYKTWTANVRVRAFDGGTPGLEVTNFRETARDADSVTFSWENGGLVNELWLWLATTAQPIASDPWPALNSVPDVRLTSVTTSYDVDLPDFGYVVVGQLCAVDEDGNVSKPWQFTVTSQDAPRLIQRVTQIAETATTVTYRIAVADPMPRNAISIAFVARNCTTDLTSPQTIAAASVTSDIATTGYVDIVVTRPAFEAGAGRVTFTASATDRISDIDAIDVPSQDGPGPVMDVKGAPGTTAFTITYTATGTLTYSVDDGAYGAVPASPFTVSRNTTGGADKVLTFKCIRNSQTATSMITVPPQEATTITCTAVVMRVYISTQDYTANTVTVGWEYVGSQGGGVFDLDFIRTAGSSGADHSQAATALLPGQSGASPQTYVHTVPDDIQAAPSTKATYSWRIVVKDSAGTVVRVSEWLDAIYNYV